MSPIRNYGLSRYVRRLPAAALLCGLLLWSARMCDFDAGALVDGLVEGRDRYARLLDFEWSAFPKMLAQAGVTALIALLATPVGALASVLMAILAARNVSRPGLRLAARLSLGFERALPEIIILFMLVAALGIGVFPAIVALAIGSVGMLGKLWADAIEEVEERSIESVRSIGATPAQTVRYAILPEILPAIVSNAIFRFEINVRAATVLGGVAGVGIGYEIVRSFALLEYGRMAVAIVVVMGVVNLCERCSGAARRRIFAQGDAIS